MEENKKEVSWTGPEYIHYEKDVSWYWISGIITILLCGWALWTKDYVFVGFILVAEAFLIFWANREPRHINFLINERFIHIDQTKIDFREIENFAIYETEEHLNELALKTKTKFNSVIKILIPKDKQDLVRQIFTARKIHEVEHTDSISDAVSRIIKF